MSSDIVDRGGVGGGGDFAAALSRFASQLPRADQAILVAVLNAVMEPWERMAARPAEELLSPEDTRLVERLVRRAKPGEG